MYRVDVTPVVGLPQFRGWSQVVSNNFNSSQLVCAFSVAGDHAGNAGRDFTEQLSHAKANSSQELNQLIENLTIAALDLDVELQLACGVFTDNSIILGTNSGSVFLKREDRTGVLLSSSKQVKIIEGKRKFGDIVVLLTHQADDFLNEVEQKFLSGFETDSVVTSIIPGLHGLDDSSLSSLAFVSGGRSLNEEEVAPLAAEVADDQTQLELEDLGADDEDQELLLNIPPALKLRGAGKKRSIDPFEITTQPAQTQLNPVLSGLGEANSRSMSVPAPVAQLGQKASLFFSKVVKKIKKIDWRSFWVKIVRLLSKFKELAGKFLKGVVAFFRKATAKDIYLQTSSPRKIMRVVLPIVAGVLIIGGLIGFRTYKVRQQVKNAETVLQPISEQITTAKDKLATEPIISREEVSQAIAQLEQLEKDFVDQRKAQQLVVEQLTTARDLYDQISGQEEFGQLEIFYDLRLIESEFLVSALDATQEQVVFLDKEKKQLIALNLSNKQVKKINLEDDSQLVDLELTDSIVTFLGKGVSTQDLKIDEAKLENVIEEGDSNREATFIEGFATYVYVLNPEKRNIYRYSKQDEGYSDPIGWVSGAAGFDYQQVSSWAIDGEVWVATRDGGLHRLATGREQEFKILGLSEPFIHSLQVFTHEDLENLYVLEPDGRRLVVLNKKGEFLKEIKSESLVSTTTLFVSEELGKAFAVSGSIVYSMSI